MFHALRQEKGSMLIYVLVVLILLGLFSQAVGSLAKQRLLRIGHLEDRQKLRWIADAGIKTGIAVIRADNKTPTTDIDWLNDTWANNPDEFANVPVGSGTFSLVADRGDGKLFYGIVDEESKMNLNTTKSSRTLSQFFHYSLHLPKMEAAAAAAALLDWMDDDEFNNDGGAESWYYQMKPTPYVSKNKPLTTISELLFIRGFAPPVYEKLLPYATISSDGPVNLNTVSEAVLAALDTGDLAGKIEAYRLGADGIMGTKDDNAFKQMDSVVEDLNTFAALNDAEKESLRSFIGSGTFKLVSSTFTITSVAQLPNRNMKLVRSCIVKRPDKIQSCQEYYTTEKVLLPS